MATKKSKTDKKDAVTSNRVLAANRKARHDFEFIEEMEAGIALQGSEVKSLRTGKVQIRDSYAKIEGNEVWVLGLHISPYEQAAGFGAHNPDRPKKLLLHRLEIERLRSKMQQDKLTLVPVSLYLKNGRVKVELALAKGRHLYDKRHELAKRDAEMEIRRTARHLGVNISR